jgi:GLPGLI family protein
MLTHICYSQKHQNIKINYEVSFKTDEKMEKNKRILQLFDLSNEGSKLSHFILIIEGDKANFYPKKYNGINKDKWDMTMIMADCENKIYINNTENKIYYNNDDSEFKENKYLVNKEINQNWIINQKDTLTINGFKCYKAVASEESITTNGTVVKNEILAWFTPELPYQFGPNGYGKLPGLILQLYANRVNFFAKTITLDINEKVEVLSKGITISENEFLKISFNEAKKNKNIKD